MENTPKRSKVASRKHAKKPASDVPDVDSFATPLRAKRGHGRRRGRDDDDHDDPEMERVASLRTRFSDDLPDVVFDDEAELLRVATVARSRISRGRRVVCDMSTNLLRAPVTAYDEWILTPGMSICPLGGIGGFRDAGAPTVRSIGDARKVNLRSVQLQGRIAMFPTDFLDHANIPQVYVSLFVVYDRSGWDFVVNGAPSAQQIYMDQQVVRIMGVYYGKTGPNCFLTEVDGNDRFRIMHRSDYVLHYKPDQQHFGYYVNTTGAMAMVDPALDGVVTTTGDITAVTPDGKQMQSFRDGLFVPVSEFVDLQGLPQVYNPTITHTFSSQLDVTRGSVFLMAYCSLPTSLATAGWTVKPELFIRSTATVKN